MGISLIRKNKYADDIAQKNVIEPTLKCDQILAYVILDQSKKNLETFSVGNQKSDVVNELDSAKVYATEVMTNLKSVEASDVPEEVVSETIATSEALNTGVTSINMNLIFEVILITPPLTTYL